MAEANKKTIDATKGLDVGELYREHGVFIGRVILQLTGGGPHVEDLLQETFLTAHRVRHTYRGTAKPSSWLYGIARNLCQHHHRSNKRLRAFIERFIGARATVERPGVEAEVETNERAAVVHRVVQKLSFKQREVFVLYELQEMKGVEIAELLAIPEATVWTRLSEGRKSFERLMARAVAAGEIA